MQLSDSPSPAEIAAMRKKLDEYRNTSYLTRRSKDKGETTRDGSPGRAAGTLPYRAKTGEATKRRSAAAKAAHKRKKELAADIAAEYGGGLFGPPKQQPKSNNNQEGGVNNNERVPGR